MKFKLNFENYLTKQKSNFEGVAKIIKQSKGEETISDSEGNGYFVNEFLF